MGNSCILGCKGERDRLTRQCVTARCYFVESVVLRF